jgi:pimeloyl-ACP methyl ester carboxylesterase
MGIDEGFFLDVGGVRQWVAVRGSDAANPALLVLPGAGAGLAAAAPFFSPWEGDFTLVHWDPPGGGYTAAANHADPTPLSYQRIANDGVAVVEAVKARCGLERLAVAATSGGTIAALKMVRARPDLFCAYIGNGQVVKRAAQERLSHQLVLARARAAGDLATVATLGTAGEPPYANIAADLAKSVYANAPTPAEAPDWGVLMTRTPPAPCARHAPAGVVPGDPMTTAFRAFQATSAELAAFDARTLGLEFDLPMHIIQGADDIHTVTSEVVAWAEEIQAPAKSLALIPDAGHLSFFWRAAMLERLKALAL